MKSPQESLLTSLKSNPVLCLQVKPQDVKDSHDIYQLSENVWCSRKVDRIDSKDPNHVVQEKLMSSIFCEIPSLTSTLYKLRYYDGSFIDCRLNIITQDYYQRICKKSAVFECLESKISSKELFPIINNEDYSYEEQQELWNCCVNLFLLAMTVIESFTISSYLQKKFNVLLSRNPSCLLSIYHKQDVVVFTLSIYYNMYRRRGNTKFQVGEMNYKHYETGEQLKEFTPTDILSKYPLTLYSPNHKIIFSALQPGFSTLVMSINNLILISYKLLSIYDVNEVPIFGYNNRQSSRENCIQLLMSWNQRPAQNFFFPSNVDTKTAVYQLYIILRESQLLPVLPLNDKIEDETKTSNIIEYFLDSMKLDLPALAHILDALGTMRFPQTRDVLLSWERTNDAQNGYLQQNIRQGSALNFLVSVLNLSEDFMRALVPTISLEKNDELLQKQFVVNCDELTLQLVNFLCHNRIVEIYTSQFKYSLENYTTDLVRWMATKKAPRPPGLIVSEDPYLNPNLIQVAIETATKNKFGPTSPSTMQFFTSLKPLLSTTNTQIDEIVDNFRENLQIIVIDKSPQQTPFIYYHPIKALYRQMWDLQLPSEQFKSALDQMVAIGIYPVYDIKLLDFGLQQMSEIKLTTKEKIELAPLLIPHAHALYNSLNYRSMKFAEVIFRIFEATHWDAKSAKKIGIYEFLQPFIYRYKKFIPKISSKKATNDYKTRKEEVLQEYNKKTNQTEDVEAKAKQRFYESKYNIPKSIVEKTDVSIGVKQTLPRAEFDIFEQPDVAVDYEAPQDYSDIDKKILQFVFLNKRSYRLAETQEEKNILWKSFISLPEQDLRWMIDKTREEFERRKTFVGGIINRQSYICCPLLLNI